MARAATNKFVGNSDTQEMQPNNMLRKPRTSETPEDGAGDLSLEVQPTPRWKVLVFGVVILGLLCAALASASSSLIPYLYGVWDNVFPPSVLVTIALANGDAMQIFDARIPATCYAEPHADYDGGAVRWGLGHKVASAAECCRACQDHIPSPDPCNVWVWCGDPSGTCWTADIHNHTTGDCWLKFQKAWDNNTNLKTSNLAINFRGEHSDTFRAEHKTAPKEVPWTAGLVPPQLRKYAIVGAKPPAAP